MVVQRGRVVPGGAVALTFRLEGGAGLGRGAAAFGSDNGKYQQIKLTQVNVIWVLRCFLGCLADAAPLLFHYFHPSTHPVIGRYTPSHFHFIATTRSLFWSDPRPPHFAVWREPPQAPRRTASPGFCPTIASRNRARHPGMSPRLALPFQCICAALHCTALHCTALHCTGPSCEALKSRPLSCIGAKSTPLPRAAVDLCDSPL